MRPVVHLEHFAHDIRVAALVALPVFVAQNQHGGRVHPVVGGNEGAAQQRLHAQHIEEIGGDYRGLHALGGGFPHQQEVHRVMLHDAAQGVVAVAVILDFLHREGDIVDVRLVELLMQHHQLPAVAIRQRAQEHAVHHAENGRVGADAESQGENRHAGKARVLHQHANAVADVLHQRLHRAPGAGVAAILLQRLDAAHAEHGMAARFPRVHSAAQVDLGLAIYVVLQFAVKIALVFRAISEKSKNGE